MPPEEYQSLMNAMNAGFAGVHSRIDAFKDEFSNHRLVCQKLFSEINSDSKARNAVESERVEERRRKIDWAKVKTGGLIIVYGAVGLAALKILLLNLDKFFK